MALRFTITITLTITFILYLFFIVVKMRTYYLFVVFFLYYSSTAFLIKRMNRINMHRIIINFIGLNQACLLILKLIRQNFRFASKFIYLLFLYFSFATRLILWYIIFTHILLLSSPFLSFEKKRFINGKIFRQSFFLTNFRLGFLWVLIIDNFFRKVSR